MDLSCREINLSKKNSKRHIDINRRNKKEMKGVRDSASTFIKKIKTNS